MIDDGEQHAVLFRQDLDWWVVASQGEDGHAIVADIAETLELD